MTRFKKELQGVGQARELAFTRTSTRSQARPRTRIHAEAFRPVLSTVSLRQNAGMESDLHLIAALQRVLGAYDNISAQAIRLRPVY